MDLPTNHKTQIKNKLRQKFKPQSERSTGSTHKRRLSVVQPPSPHRFVSLRVRPMKSPTAWRLAAPVMAPFRNGQEEDGNRLKNNMSNIESQTQFSKTIQNTSCITLVLFQKISFHFPPPKKNTSPNQPPNHLFHSTSSHHPNLLQPTTSSSLQAGTVWVNRHCEFIRNAPFGGIDSSGIGRAGDLGDQERLGWSAGEWSGLYGFFNMFIWFLCGI